MKWIILDEQGLQTKVLCKEHMEGKLLIHLA